MDLGLSGKKAIICASSRGLGKGCAIALAQAGCDLVINGRDASVLTAAANDIRASTGVAVVEVATDVSTTEGQRSLLEACPEPDILVNNNGGPPHRDFRELDRASLLEGLTNNMITPIELIQQVVDGMCERGFGRIVNITSSSVYMPIPGLDLSSGARAGLTSFLAGVARSVADRNVTINTLLPGKMDTDRLAPAVDKAASEFNLSREEAKAKLVETVPARRMGTAAEFGQACAFLCSAQAGYITGQNLLVDGGLVPSAF